jgi:DNA polymerase elongation subunit (family B)
MYKSIYYDRNNNQIHLWTDGKHHDKPYECFNYQKYAYTIDSRGEHLTLNNLKVKKVKTWTKQAEEEGMVFEHDVLPTTRVLIDRYSKYDDVSQDHVVLFFDIEVEKGLRYSKPHEALNVINAISYYDTASKGYTCLLLDRSGEVQDKTLEDGTSLKRFSTEEELLLYFVNEWRQIGPSIVTGWNSSRFDVPYLYKRLLNLFGEETASMLSPIGIVNERHFGRDYEVNIAGITSMDYLVLYQKFTYNEESSFKLEAIAQKELGRGKVQYEGTLDDFYKNDLDGFIKYNVTDVELLVAMDKKLDLIEISRGICHAGFVSYDDFQYSSKYLDGAALAYCKQNNLVSIRLGGSSEMKTSGKAVGAMVKIPQKGIYKFVIDQDLTSLYPSLIRMLNISPETMVGEIVNWDEDDWVNKTEKMYKIYIYSSIPDKLAGIDDKYLEISNLNIREFLEKSNYCISSNGILYDKSRPGLLPSILTKWFNERKRLSKLAEEYGLAGDKVKYKFYDQKQLIQKILLNSFYGVLLLPSFRFYNKKIGESVTLTGQSVIKFSMKVANLYYNKKLNTESVDYVLAGDTDSLFFSPLPIIRLTYQGDDEETLVKMSLEIALELQNLINKSYDVYSDRFHNLQSHCLNIKQEMVAKRAFWGQAKKRYAMWIINKKGVPKNEPEIKGFDSVRSDFPKYFRKILEELIVDILHDATVTQLNAKVRQFKKSYLKQPYKEILVPNSVKELSKYTDGQKGSPINVKSAQNYNKLLRVYNLETYPKIEDGDKILYGYLTENPFGFETLAITGYDDPPEILEFMETYLDKHKIFESKLVGKIESIWEDLGFGKLELKTSNDIF